MFYFDEVQLRSVQNISIKHSTQLKNCSLLVLEHILPTTVEFILLLKRAGVHIPAIVAKPYSIHQESLEKLESYVSPDLIKKIDSYDEIERNPNYLKDLLIKTVDECKQKGNKLIILDVGGYFAKPVVENAEELKNVLVGIIEDTTFGHNRYNHFKEELSVPIFSVARSSLKEIEARFVGRDAVTAMDLELRKIGITMSGRNALVLGYGMIGKNVARTLKRHDLNVAVYDRDDLKNLTAFTDGYKIHKKNELLPNADIIFSATGTEALHESNSSWPKNALSLQEIKDFCRNNVILASVGSRNTEFEVSKIINECPSPIGLSPILTQYDDKHMGKQIIVANKGTAVNFLLESIPREILDLVFSEILMCIISLLTEGDEYETQRIYQVKDDVLNKLSHTWLRSANRQP